MYLGIQGSRQPKSQWFLYAGVYDASVPCGTTLSARPTPALAVKVIVRKVSYPVTIADVVF